MSHSALTILDLKFAALSATSVVGQPYRHIIFSYKILATSSALCVFKANASVMWLNESIAKRIFLLPFLLPAAKNGIYLVWL